MKRLFASVALFLFLTTTCSAEIFFKRNEKLWTVYGIQNEVNKNPACIAQQSWKDGSSIQLIKDLSDGELYIAMINNEWQITDPPGKYNMQVTVYTREEVTSTFTFEYTLIPKNHIVIRNIFEKDFIPNFVSASKLRFIMPGTIPNADINLQGSKAAIESIIDCAKKYKKSFI